MRNVRSGTPDTTRRTLSITKTRDCGASDGLGAHKRGTIAQRVGDSHSHRDQILNLTFRSVQCYRLCTTILDPAEARATELATAYAQRWKIELALDELKAHQRGPRTVLRARSPEVVLQRIWGHLCCHYAKRAHYGYWPQPRRQPGYTAVPP